MLVRPLRLSILPVSLVILSILLTGCAGSLATPTPETGTYSIDPVFREFYTSLGGRNVLGPAITTLFNFRSKQCQYAQNALLCFDSLQQGIARYSLFPLGQSLGIQEKPGLEMSGELVVDGFQIYEEFEPIYHKLYGPLYVGRPLTQPRFNTNKNRIEQYFENVGFYRNLEERAGEVHLLAYGVYACDSDCRYSPPQSGIVVPSISNFEQPFLTQVARLGGLTVFGMALTNPYITAEGRLEQIYENVVLSAPLDDPNSVSLRSLPLQLGMPVSPPGPKVYSEANGVAFYTVDGDLGYHVPLPFDHFIAQHGGREISGKPLAEVAKLEANLYRQCFENYCLLYDNAAEASQKVRMSPLGMDFIRTTQGLPVEEAASFVFEPETVHLLTNAASPRVPSSEPQQFDLTLLRTSDQQPIPDVESSLTLTLPNGKQGVYVLPPSDKSGRSSLTVAPLSPVPDNGSVVAFKICLNVPSSLPICASDSYLIWNFQ